MVPKKYDIIFTGGGAACRMLLYFLSEHPSFKQLQILVLEAVNTTAEKTWCFWGTNEHPFQQLACKQWHQLQFEAKDIVSKQAIHPFSYTCINGSDFDAFFATDFFQTHKNIETLPLVVTAVQQQQQQQFIVEAGTQRFTAPLVFNSIPALQTQTEATVDMWQHFEGWFIETAEPCFDVAAASLMNFSDYDDGAFRFLYVLPFTAKQALIEYTFYSGEIYSSVVYEEKIRQYLQAQQITNYTIVKKEKGKIPLLSTSRQPAVYTSGIIDIGTAGGLVKPSTGYAFQRMVEDCKTIADSVLSSQTVRRRKRSRRFLFYDHLLLRIIKEDPACAVDIFKQLFRKQPMQRILTFLNEDSSLLDEVRIFLSLPWMPFLRRINLFK